MSTPHDAIVKAVLGQPEHARGVLRTLVPAALADELDWQTLELQPGSMVKADLGYQHTDLLYSVDGSGGDETFIYILFEHQSSPSTDGPMSLRMLKYQAEIWERWRLEHWKPKAPPSEKRLPMIIPIVLYHGEDPWPEPRAFDALLDVPAGVRPAVEPYLVRFEYVLHDLSQISDDDLRDGAMSTALARLVSLCLKHAWTGPNFIKILSDWVNVMRDVLAAPHGLEAFQLVLRYVLKVNRQVELAALKTLLEEVGPEAKDAIVTVAQQLIQEGTEQGLEQGLERSRHRLRAMLLRMLRQRFGGAVDAQVEQRLAAASTEQLETWTERVPSAATLSELFAG